MTGRLVYVNYGRVEDLRELEDMGVSVQGHICIARYGKIFRGNKVNLSVCTTCLQYSGERRGIQLR